MLEIFKRWFGFNEPKPAEEIKPTKKTKTPEEVDKAIREIKRYPVKKMTREEFDELSKNVSREFINTCPIGTWFFCNPMPEAPDLRVVGQVVKGEDADTKQFGSGVLCGTHEREINRYLLEITG